MSGSDSPPRTQRLFFALWPDDATRQLLAKVARKYVRGRGRLVAAANIHLTLIFLGPVDRDCAACIERVADGIRAAPISLVLECLGHWPKPRIAWSGSACTPVALASLVAALGNGLADCGFASESRPYQAHVTLARKVGGRFESRTHKPIVWEAREFCLVRSLTHRDGVVYQPLKRWALTGDDKSQS